MRSFRYSVCMLLAIPILSIVMIAQQAASQASSLVPRLVNFAGKASDAQGKPIRGVVGVTFAIYKDQSEGAPLWLETQNLTADANGNYAGQLGASKSGGLPLELFSSGEARWLGVRVNGGEDQPRVLLISVPYALRAADAETVGGLPASAFVLASTVGAASPEASETSGAAGAASVPPPATITGSGTPNFLPLFTGAATVANSALFQSGASPTAKIGINTNVPAATLDVKGTETVRGTLTLPATGVATATAGKASQPQNFVASAFNSASSTATNETFHLQAEPAGNNTSNTGGSLSLLFGQGTSAPAETGFKIASNGHLTFAAGQTFPGTVTSVGLSAPSADFTVTGSPLTGSGTLGMKWKLAPTSANTASAIVKRDSAGGFSAGGISATAITATASSNTGLIQATNSNAWAIYGQSANNSGVIGVATTYGWAGVLGSNTNAGGIGVEGFGVTEGVHAEADLGVRSIGGTYGVYSTSDNTGVYGNGANYGVWGETSGSDGVHGISHAAGGSGVGAVNDAGGDGIFAAATNGGFAGFFLGDVDVDGNLSKAGGSFKIDHPLDPSEKYLYHSFVESPDMKNIYDGNVTTDAQGNAVVTMPEWFEALNRDFRYQLTVIGQFAEAVVASKISNHRFAIRTDKPNVEVSWQVTGIRQDAWANAHRIPVEQLKPEKERGFYLHPELFGAPAEKSTAWARHPDSMKRQNNSQPKAPLVRARPLAASR